MQSGSKRSYVTHPQVDVQGKGLTSVILLLLLHFSLRLFA